VIFSRSHRDLLIEDIVIFSRSHRDLLIEDIVISSSKTS